MTVASILCHMLCVCQHKKHAAMSVRVKPKDYKENHVPKLPPFTEAQIDGLDVTLGRIDSDEFRGELAKATRNAAKIHEVRKDVFYKVILLLRK